MEAIVLAAGQGTRLRPYTATTPKPLLLVQGRPILDWILATLPPVERLIVVVHHLAEQVEDYLREQRHIRHWVSVYQEQPRGTGHALMSCRHLVASERCLVVNGDDLIPAADLARLAVVPQGLLVHPVTMPHLFGIVFRHPDGTLERIVEKPADLPPPQWANIGAYLFPRCVFDLELPLSPRGEYEITDAITQLAQQFPFYVVEAQGWIPIGNLEQWEAAQQADLTHWLVREPG